MTRELDGTQAPEPYEEVEDVPDTYYPDGTAA